MPIPLILIAAVAGTAAVAVASVKKKKRLLITARPALGPLVGVPAGPLPRQPLPVPVADIIPIVVQPPGPLPPYQGGFNEQPMKASNQWLSWFGQILRSHGVHNFTARELTSARAGGGLYKRPPTKHVRRLLHAAMVAQAIRDAWGAPLSVSSGYRPWDAAKSPHYRAAAIDLDLPSGHKTVENEHALRLLVARYWLSDPNLAGMGFYGQPRGRVHIDVMHQGSRGRFSYYDEYVDPILAEIEAAQSLPGRAA